MRDVVIARSARACVETCGTVCEGEEALIVTDTLSDMTAVTSLATAVSLAGAVPTVAIMPVTRWAGDDPSRAVQHALDGVDVVLALTHMSLGHARSITSRLEAGAFRYVSLPGVTAADMATGACAADYEVVYAIGDSLRRRVEGCRRIHVTSELGTDLVAELDGMPIRHDHGAQEPGDVACFPGGEVWQAPREGTANGTVVVDTTVSMLGRLAEPIRLSVREGDVTEIEGGADAQRLRELVEGVENAGNLAELSIGTNPWARTTGNVSEDKKLLGSVHIALGDNRMLGGTTASAIHLDGVISLPTVTLDGVELVRAGSVDGLDDLGLP